MYKKRTMALAEIVNKGEVRNDLMKMIKNDWAGIPDNFFPTIDLNKPYNFKDLTKITLKGINNHSEEVISLKELNFLFHYCFVIDFSFFVYKLVDVNPNNLYFLPDVELPAFEKYAHKVDLVDLERHVSNYTKELQNYINITGRTALLRLLD